MLENNDVGAQVGDAIWWEYEYEKILNCDKKGIGIRSTKSSKLNANLLLKRYLESEYLQLKHNRTITELSQYEEVRPDVFQASQTDHDDCVTSLLWALYFLTTEFFEMKDETVKVLDKKYHINGQEKNKQDNDTPIMLFDSDADDVFQW